MSKDTNKTIKDQVSAELDKRKIQNLIDAGVIKVEDVARAPIIRSEPSCNCNQGLEMNDKKFGHFPHAQLVCPKCHKESKDIYLCRMCGNEVDDIQNEDVCLDCYTRYV